MAQFIWLVAMSATLAAVAVAAASYQPNEPVPYPLVIFATVLVTGYLVRRIGAE